MDFPNEFLDAVMNAGICDMYYSICAEHTLRLNATKEASSSRAVLAAAKGRIGIKELDGPGAVFQLTDAPEPLAMNFIIQSRGSIETDFTVPFEADLQRATFATLCNAATLHAGKARSNPPYPRPTFLSVEELIAIFEKLRSLLLRLPKGTA